MKFPLRNVETKALWVAQPRDSKVTRFENSLAKKFLKIRVVATMTMVALTAGWITPISAFATAQYPSLTVSVAAPEVQSYAASGLVSSTPVLVEDFDNATFDWIYPACDPNSDADCRCDQNGENCQRITCDENDPNYCWNLDEPAYQYESPVGTFRNITGNFYPADMFGGAGGTGKYASAGNLVLTLSDQSDYKYLGFWWSAGSAGNEVELLDEDENVLARFTVDEGPNNNEDLLGVTAADAYTHNPNRNVCNRWQGQWWWDWQNCWQTWEKYAFVHLRYPPGFRKVRFSASGNGFEFDNVTVSREAPTFAASETTTETFNSYELSTPAVLLADPRTGEIRFPGVQLGAGATETNAMLCISEVADQAGSALSGTTTFQISEPGAALTVGGDNSLRTFSGARADVVSFSSGVVLTPSNLTSSFGVVGSRFIRVSATPQINAGIAGCTGNATDSEIVEIRFINILQRNTLQIRID
jgi:hypothetical protein